jgi:hypothetical protein
LGRRYDPAAAHFPHVERGGRLVVEHYDTAWVIQSHVLREYGVTLAGPPIAGLIDPVPPADLRQAIVRVLYTLATGRIVSKRAAATWAAGALEPRWRDLIDQAAAWRNGMPLDRLPEALALIAHTLNVARGRPPVHTSATVALDAGAAES